MRLAGVDRAARRGGCVAARWDCDLLALRSASTGSTQRPLVALLFGASATSPAVLSFRSAFLQGLRELGYVESTPVRLACTTNLAD